MAKGLDFDRRNRSKRGNKRLLVCLFLCFAVLLGAFSYIYVWRYYGYNWNNVFNTGESTAAAPKTTEQTESPSFEGEYTFLNAVISDDKQDVRSISLISVDLATKTVRVTPVEKEITDGVSGFTYAQLLLQKGGAALMDALSVSYGTTVSKYMIFTDAGYKRTFILLGDITMNISDDVEYDTDDMYLELKRGENTLTGEKVYKYMRYVSDAQSGYESAKHNAEITVAAFRSFFNSEKFAYADALFRKVSNQCESDISIVDYTNAKEKIASIIPATNKDSLKVYVSKELKETTNEEK